MKQHIRVEQVMELTNEQFDKLLELTKGLRDIKINSKRKLWNEVYWVPQLNIGQMIEIWENHQPNYWINSITHFDNLGNVYLKDEYQGCLCDALWELTVWGIENNILKGEC